MRLFLRRSVVSIGLLSLVVLAILALKSHTVQDRLLDSVIARFMSSSPDALFKDDALRVVICGSASPMPVQDRAAACVMVIAGGKYYLVDTGNRSTNNLGLWRIPADRLGAVFLTHFHSDHIGDLGELNMVTWAQGRPKPLHVYGPTGVSRVVAGFEQAYALDSHYRTAHHGDDLLNPEKGKMVPIEIEVTEQPKLILDEDGLRVTLFRVGHDPIDPAVGYRFDYRDRSVVVSGDTVKSASLVAASKEADVLIHEALAMHIVGRMQAQAKDQDRRRLERIFYDIQDYHTSPVEAAEVANDAKVKELVLYHLVPSPTNKLVESIFLRGVSSVRPDGVTLAEDGMVIDLPLSSETVIFGSISDY